MPRRQLLKDEFQVFKYMVENSIDAMLMTDSESRIIYSNRACNQLLAQNIAGRSLKSLWHPDDHPLLNSITEWAKASVFSAARLNGFHSVIDPYPNIEVVGTLAADWNRDQGRRAAEEFLKANPRGTLDVIWAASGEMGLGAMQAVEAARRQDEVKIFTNDVTPESADRMREGRLLAETHHGFAEWGWYGVKFAVMLALGQAAPRSFDIRPRTMHRGNADLFHPQPALEPIDWDGMKRGRPLPEKIVIGWVQAAATGVFQTATRYFEQAAADARASGINVEVITRIPNTPETLTDEVVILEEYIQRRVDVIVLSTIWIETIRQKIREATQAGIAVIVVNQLEPIESVKVASYIGIDNTVAGIISGYTVVNYLGGPGILGKGRRISARPGTHLDLEWWQTLYQTVDPKALEVKGRVAIIEGISGSWRGENRLQRLDGSVIPVDSILFPIYNRASRFIGLSASFRDVTERKQAEAALRRAHDELELRVEERTAELAKTHAAEKARTAELAQAYHALQENQQKLLIAEKMASLGRLTAGIAHEMNTPLAAARTALVDLKRLIREYQDSIHDSAVTAADHQEISGEMQQAARLATTAIEGALEFVRGIKAQTRDLAPREPALFNMVTVIDDALLLLSYLARQEKCRLQFEPDQADIELIGAPGRLTQLVTNLVTNAIEASAVKGGGLIRLRLQLAPDRIILQVSDEGSGIAPEHLSKIFDPLFTTKPFGESSGLGLTIAHDIVVADFGGSIQVDSEAEKGTTFTISFPRRHLASVRQAP